MQPSGQLSAQLYRMQLPSVLFSPHLKAADFGLTHWRAATMLTPMMMNASLAPLPPPHCRPGATGNGDKEHVFLVTGRSWDDNCVSRGGHTMIDAQRE